MSQTEYPYPPSPTPPGFPPVTQVKGSNGLATAGFVLGLLGLLGSWIPFLNVLGIMLGILGAILAAVGLAKFKKVNAGKGLAIAGLVLGVLAVLFAIVINVAFVGAVDKAIDETTSTKVEQPAGSGESDEVGTTRENPAPLGSAVSGGDWTVTINSVKTVKKDSFDQRAADGSVLLLVNLSATYTGDDEQGESAWANVKYVAPDGTTFDSTTGSTMFVEEDGFDSLKTLYNGGTVKGDRIIEVPADGWKKGVLAVSPALLSDDTFVAVK